MVSSLDTDEHFEHVKVYSYLIFKNSFIGTLLEALQIGHITLSFIGFCLQKISRCFSISILLSLILGFSQNLCINYKRNGRYRQDKMTIRLRRCQGLAEGALTPLTRIRRGYGILANYGFHGSRQVANI